MSGGVFVCAFFSVVVAVVIIRSSGGERGGGINLQQLPVVTGSNPYPTDEEEEQPVLLVQ